jgi:hypothetical protein
MASIKYRVWVCLCLYVVDIKRVDSAMFYVHNQENRFIETMFVSLINGFYQ